MCSYVLFINGDDTVSKQTRNNTTSPTLPVPKQCISSNKVTIPHLSRRNWKHMLPSAESITAMFISKQCGPQTRSKFLHYSRRSWKTYFRLPNQHQQYVFQNNVFPTTRLQYPPLTPRPLVQQKKVCFRYIDSNQPPYIYSF